VNDKLPIQSSNHQSRAELLKTVGVAVLVLGFIAASILYWTGEKGFPATSHEPETPELERSWKDGTLSPEDLKGSSRTIEMNYGKVAVLLVNWMHRWGELKPHQLLAVFIATMATLIATCCFLIAKRLLRRRI
jgi:hypothetical protein